MIGVAFGGIPKSFCSEARMNPIIIRCIEPSDEDTVASFLDRSWGSRMVVSRGKIYDAAKLPGFLAIENEEVVGLLTLTLAAHDCEVITLDAFVPGRGVGSRLLEEAQAEAAKQGCRRLWLITTNNNLNGIAFYQKRGLRMVAIYRDAVTEARKLKPQIPLVAENGIPIRDEIEFEVVLA